MVVSTFVEKPSVPGRRPSSFWSPGLTEDTRESRDFMGARLVLFMGLIAVLSGGFYLANVLVTMVVQPHALVEAVAHSSAVAHLVATLIAAGCWALARRSSVGVRALDRIDFGGTFGICLMYGLMIPGERAGHEA